jgi:arsenite-transporting ATPase
MTMPSFLTNGNFRLLLFGGKGGVGKTTCATASALWLARSAPESSILLVSTDPAHSLVDSLAGSAPYSNLQILELDAGQCLADFKKKHLWAMQEIASRGTFLDEDDIARVLDLSLPGMDEMMAFLQISQWVESQAYSCIVVDTAPTGHTLRLLAMPDLIRKWLEALNSLLAKHRYMKKVIGGVCHRDALDQFLGELATSVRRLQTLLQNSVDCQFVPVMLAEFLSVNETADLVAELENVRIPATNIVVNRLYPSSLCPFCADGHGRQMRELRHAFREGGLASYIHWGVPLYATEVRGVTALDSFWNGATVLEVAETDHPQGPADEWKVFPSLLSENPKIEGTAEYPSPETTLLLFAGKGGVGKTTLACATAIQLAREHLGERILLFSVDPAHSLSDCLGLNIGSSPTPVCPGLAAVEIDANKEFSTLKRQYRKELEKFWSQSAHLDLTFDREVLERMLDLSPPGLDEAMALTKLMEILAGGQHDRIILDAAPTGHLIRLLELPEMIDQWLKVFFRLFLKYRQVFRLPQTSARLVEISKNLKALRALLHDPDRSSLYIVTILTEMALAETTDLADACKNMGINNPVMFINLATPESDCALCSAICQRESRVKEKFQQAFRGRHLVLIYRQTEPRGLEHLGALGQAMYQAQYGGTALAVH